ncbi:replication protein A 70 kDa DNA-binding subunit B [Tanacetum coccineum]
MEMNLNQLCDLDSMIDDSKILARCISIWKSHPLGKPNEVWSLDAVLQDQQGNRVQATGTTVTMVGSFDNNPRGFKFKHFTAFTARKFAETELYDVIGTVVSVSDAILFNNYWKDQLRRTIILEDVQGAQLECCFFDAWCNKFAKLHDERETMGHVVMILQSCKVKYFNEKPSVSPAMYSTKLYLNDELMTSKKYLLSDRV